MRRNPLPALLALLPFAAALAGGPALATTSTSITASNIGASTATLTVVGTSAVWYYKYTVPAGDTSCTSVAANTSTADVTGLSGNTSYTFAAYTDSDCSTQLGTAAAIFLTKPPKPATLTATAGTGSGRLVLSSSVTGAGALEKWQYKQKAAGESDFGNWQDISSTSTTLSHTVSNLIDGTNYQFKVRAKNATGFSAESDPSVAAAPLDEVLSVDNVGPAGVRLTIVNWPHAWHYKYTSLAGDGNCEPVAADAQPVTVTGLTPATIYSFKAYSAGSCATSTELAAAPPFATLTPALAAGDVRATSARLTISNWSAAWYYKYTAPSGDASCTAVAAYTATADLTGLAPATSYTFKAYSDASCNTELAAAAAFSTLTPGLSAGDVKAASAVLTISNWSAVWYYKHTAPSGGQCSSMVAAGTSTADVTGLATGTSHIFRAYRDNNCQTLLATAPAVTTIAPQLSVGDVETASAALTISDWPDAWYYKYTSPSGGQCSSAVAANTPTAALTLLAPGTSYTFRAYRDNGCSMLLATAPAFLTKPDRVTGVAVESLDRALRVSWSAAAGAARYELQYRRIGAADWTGWTRAGAGLSETITGLGNGAAYTVRVRAAVAAVSGAWSSEAVGTPGAALRKRLARVNAALAPEAARAFAGSAARVVSDRIAYAISGDAAPPARALAGFVERHGEALSQGRLTPGEALAGAAASLPFAGSQGGGAFGGGVWAAGDYSRLAGGGRALDWDGSASGLYLGADAALAPGLLGGAALSVSEAAFDYADRAAGAAFKGKWTARMTGVHPYAAQRWADGSRLWAMAGYGRGEVEVEDGETGRPQTADSEMASLAAGGSLRLTPMPAGGPALDLKGEALAARFDLRENGDLVRAAEADVHRLRAALAGVWALPTGPGASLAPSAELGLRHDGGDGETGFGLEMGAGLAWSAPAQRLRLEANARALLAHGGALDEWGAGGLVRLEPDGRGRGLSLSLSPSVGHAGSGLDRLWEEGVAADGAASSGARPAARLAAGAGYGLPLPGALLTPRIGLAATDGGQRRYSAGLALERGPEAALALETARTRNPRTPPETALTLTLNLRW